MGQSVSHLNGMGSQLIKASKAGDADAVTELVSTNPQLLRFSTFRHLSPAHFAARGDHVEVLQRLVAKAQEVEQLQWQAADKARIHFGGAPRPAQDHQPHPQPSQHRRQDAGGQQHSSLVQQVVDATSDRGITPLMLAVDGSCVASVKLLLDKGADPWAVDKLGGRTSLHYAARTDNTEILELLIDAAGSSGRVQFPNRPNTSYVDVRTQAGFTAIHFAVQAHSQQTLAVLLNLGANPLLSTLFDCLDTINCPKGTTPLHLAARQGSTGVVKQLLRAYVEYWYHRHLPDPRLLVDGDSFLPCQVAARRNHEVAAHMLMPSNPITSMFADGDASLVGPPSLAAIAGAVLRVTLAGDLDQVMQQQEGQSEEQTEEEQGSAPAAAAAAEQDGSCAEADGVVAAASASEDGAGDVPAAPAHITVEAAPSPASSDAVDAVCGVCFDAPPQVQLSPCGHSLCTDCCQSLLAMNSRCVMVCPFCRGGVGHLQPVSVPAAGAAGCTGGLQAAAAVHVPLRPEPALPLTRVGSVA